MTLEASAPAPHLVVLGGGISGLTAAYQALKGLPAGARLTVLEAANRWGGRFVTIRRDGFIIEAGPEGFVAGSPDVAALCADLGLQDSLIQASRTAGGTSVLINGRLVPVTSGVTSVLPLRAGLLIGSALSPLGALRVLLEPLIPRGDVEGDESLESLLTRRYGREAYTNVLEPLLGGVGGGGAAQLSAKGASPALPRLEERYGSITGGLRRQRGPVGAAGAGLVAPRDGMDRLIDALVERLAPDSRVDLRLSSPATALRRAGNRWEIQTGAGAIGADVVISAIPSNDLAPLLGEVDPAMASVLGEITYRSMASLSFGFRAGEVTKRLRGAGYVKRASERTAISSCAWDSYRWAGHAPEGYHLIRLFVSDEAAITMPDDKLIATGRDELRRLQGITAEPVFAELTRFVPALPRYTIGHLDRVATLEKGLARHPGLLLTGMSYRGRGVSDCIREAGLTALRALEQLPAA